MTEEMHEIDRIMEAKASIVNAIENKGVSVAESAKINDLSQYINQINDDKAPAIHADQHRSSNTITWDGDPTGMTTADFPIEGWTFVHMSDATPSVSDVVSKAMFALAYKDDEETGEIVDESFVESVSDDCFVIDFFICFIQSDNCAVDLGGGIIATFPKKGIYFGRFTGSDVTDYATKLTIPGYNLSGGIDPITPEMISAAPDYHASVIPKYGVADEAIYGHARAYTTFYSVDPEGMTLADPNGNEFKYGVPNGYFPDMGFFNSICSLIFLTFGDYDLQLSAIAEVLQEHENKIAQLEKDVAALKG